MVWTPQLPLNDVLPHLLVELSPAGKKGVGLVDGTGPC